MILDRRTGRQVPIRILPAAAKDLRRLGRGWNFDWPAEAKVAEVFKLVAREESANVLGLVSLIRNERERYLQVSLLESSPSNVGRTKRLDGIAGHLLAFAARLSFALDFDGFLFLEAKTVLIGHYCGAYGFEQLGRTPRLVLETAAAAKLIKRFPLEAG